MITTKLDNFDRAVNTAVTWLSDISEHLQTGDRKAAHRATRAWLHLLRDRLTVDSAVKFGAQLPELIRGIYYDGWDPSRAPIKYSPQEYVTRFAGETNTPIEDVPRMAASITAALSEHMSGQLAEALGQLPRPLQAVIEHGAPAGPPGTRPIEHDEVADLRGRVETLTEAVRALAISLEGSPLDDELDSEARRARAARLAAELLMTIK